MLQTMKCLCAYNTCILWLQGDTKPKNSTQTATIVCNLFKIIISLYHMTAVDKNYFNKHSMVIFNTYPWIFLAVFISTYNELIWDRHELVRPNKTFVRALHTFGLDAYISEDSEQLLLLRWILLWQLYASHTHTYPYNVWNCHILHKLFRFITFENNGEWAFYIFAAL